MELLAILMILFTIAAILGSFIGLILFFIKFWFEVLIALVMVYCIVMLLYIYAKDKIK